MTVTADGMARSSLAARLDIFIPRLFLSRGRYPSIRQALPVRYCNPGYVIDVSSASRPRKASRVAPARVQRSCWGQAGKALLRRHQHGVDHVDDAVRLIHIRDRDGGRIPLGVDDRHL